MTERGFLTGFFVDSLHRVPMDSTYSQVWFDTFLKTVPAAQTEAEVNLIARFLPEPDFRTILDVGCGSGRHDRLLARCGYRVTGIDNDPRALEMAGQVKGVEFLLKDMLALDELPGQFDGALSLWQSFGYFDPDTNAWVLGQLNRKLRKGGRLVLDIYHRGFFEKNQGIRRLERGGLVIVEHTALSGNRLNCRLEYDSDQPPDTFEWQLFTPEEIVQLADEAGFTCVLACTGFDESRPPTADSPRMQFVFEKYEDLDEEHLASQANRNPILLRRDHFLQAINRCMEASDLGELRGQVARVKDLLRGPKNEPTDERDEEVVTFRQDILLSELDQILSARTLQRAHYYLNRLQAEVEETRTNDVNDINLRRWKEYDEILTDSLWTFARRDTSGAHLAWYWGNFIPQIPRQMMLRYTHRGDWVLDPFAGSGTTLIECRRLGRNGLGIELNPQVAAQARERIAAEANEYEVSTEVVTADSTRADLHALLQEQGIEKVQLVLLHPPYHDIIRFSDDPRDLSNAASVQDFLKLFGQVVDQTTPALEDGRYLAVVIGDKYAGREWVPLGFYVMQEVLERGYSLKGIVVKNFDETRAKRQQKELWRYRALVGGFYVFKHEYILVFRKS